MASDCFSSSAIKRAESRFAFAALPTPAISFSMSSEVLLTKLCAALTRVRLAAAPSRAICLARTSESFTSWSVLTLLFSTAVESDTFCAYAPSRADAAFAWLSAVNAVGSSDGVLSFSPDDTWS